MADTTPNELYLGWLKEWMDQAHERNSKGHIVYKKAWSSMKASTVQFQHASEAEILNGIGPTLCRRLEEKHKLYCELNGLPAPRKVRRRATQQADTSEVVDDTNPQEDVEEPPKKKRKVKEYVPKLGTGSYALIKALSTLDEDGKKALSKKDLIDVAQQYCDSSFTTVSDTTKLYTAWKSMQDLERKELVCTRGHPTKRYYLSDEGWDLAKRMKSQEEGQIPAKLTKAVKENAPTEYPSVSKAAFPNTSTVVELESTPEPETPARRLIPIKDSGPSARRSTIMDTVSSQPIVLKPGTFEVKLLLDTREIRSTHDRTYVADELRKHGVVPDLRALPLGDALWVARIKPPHDSAFKYQNPGDDEEGCTEVILEHVLERKRLDDLIYSIKDGRFHEQKFRLKKSGIRHVTYLVEEFSISSEKAELYGDTMESAIASMQVVNDIFVKKTGKIDESIRYLAQMTDALKKKYEQQELHILPSASLDASTHYNHVRQVREQSPTNTYCITFSAFASLCDKSDSLTLADVFLKMLMCIKGVTGEKAIEIQKIWPTPNALLEAYAGSKDRAARESLISDQLSGKIPRKQITRTLSAQIANVWAG